MCGSVSAAAEEGLQRGKDKLDHSEAALVRPI